MNSMQQRQRGGDELRKIASLSPLQMKHEVMSRNGKVIAPMHD